MKKIDVWTSYNFECECGHDNGDIHDSFEWNPEEGAYTMLVTCIECGEEFLAEKPE